MLFRSISEYTRKLGEIQNQITNEFERINMQILDNENRIRDLVIDQNKKF